MAWRGRVGSCRMSGCVWPTRFGARCCSTWLENWKPSRGAGLQRPSAGCGATADRITTALTHANGAYGARRSLHIARRVARPGGRWGSGASRGAGIAVDIASVDGGTAGAPCLPGRRLDCPVLLSTNGATRGVCTATVGLDPRCERLHATVLHLSGSSRGAPGPWRASLRRQHTNLGIPTRDGRAAASALRGTERRGIPADRGAPAAYIRGRGMRLLKRLRCSSEPIESNGASIQCFLPMPTRGRFSPGFVSTRSDRNKKRPRSIADTHLSHRGSRPGHHHDSWLGCRIAGYGGASLSRVGSCPGPPCACLAGASQSIHERERKHALLGPAAQ